MSKYFVTYSRQSFYTATIEATDIDEARSKAWSMELDLLIHDYDSGVYHLENVQPKIQVSKK